MPVRARWRILGACAAAAAAMSAGALAESCTTQAKLTVQQRADIGGASFALASAVKAGDPARVRSDTVAQYAGDPNQTAFLVRATGERLSGDTLAVSEVYLLDATNRTAGNNAEAAFSCPLAGTSSETDFSINGLPPGLFAFAMVEARGASPYLLAFLLQQEGNSWKMAGFYPHTRSAAGHEGLWYWTTARADAKANKPWLAWLLFGEADQLLRPASFVSSGNLDKLRSEQRTAAPQPLTNGISAETPLSVQGTGGSVYRLSDVNAQASEDGKVLNLWLHLQLDKPLPTDQVTATSVEAAQAFVTAHPDLRDAFSNVWVVAEGAGTGPITTTRPMAQLAAASR